MNLNEIKKIVGDCSAEIFGRKFRFAAELDRFMGPWMEFSIRVDTESVFPEDQKAVKTLHFVRQISISSLSDKETILRIVLGMFQDFMLHEAMETFNYQGKQHLNPHQAA